MTEELKPWETEEGKVVWKTKSQYFTWLRGGLRKLWSDYPLRKVWKKKSLRPVTKEEKLNKTFHSATKNVGMCVFCKEWMAGSHLECDHIKESSGCYDFTTAKDFLLHCAAQDTSNFQLVCKPCHKIKSHQDRKGYDTMLEALADKCAILLEKEKLVLRWLRVRKRRPFSNAKRRRQQMFDLVLEDLKGKDSNMTLEKFRKEVVKLRGD